MVIFIMFILVVKVGCSDYLISMAFWRKGFEKVYICKNKEAYKIFIQVFVLYQRSYKQDI